jgi:hypothetical protein
MMIPSSTDYSAVMGKPTLFGPQEGLKGVLDVISGGLPTDRFTLPQGESADLQFVALGNDTAGAGLSGGYREFYLGISSAGDGYSFTAEYLQPDASIKEKAQEIADQNGLAVSSQGSITEVSGNVSAEELPTVLTAFLQP